MAEKEITMLPSDSYFWKEVPHNVLCHPHKVSHNTLMWWRIIGTLFCLASTAWACVWAIQEGQTILKLEAYLTIWGVWFCTLYFCMIHCVKNAPHESYAWKFVYILGEMAFCMEFLIAPFFWAILFPLMKNVDLEGFIFNVFIHLLCAIFIWGEVIMNHMKFPHSHRIILIIIATVYMVNNFLWSCVFTNSPIYPVITWKTPLSYVFLVAAIVIAIAGYEVGRWQGRKKSITGTHQPLVDEKQEP